MQPDDLDRRRQAIGVFALVDGMEAVEHARDRVGIDDVAWEKDLDRMLLVLVAALDVRDEVYPLRSDTLVSEAVARLFPRLPD